MVFIDYKRPSVPVQKPDLPERWGKCPLETEPQRPFLPTTAFLYPQIRFKHMGTKKCLLPSKNALTDVT